VLKSSNTKIKANIICRRTAGTPGKPILYQEQAGQTRGGEEVKNGSEKSYTESR